jgi:uracil-DNA glycosylase family 4
MGKVDFITGLKSLLRYHDTIGITHYPLTEGIGTFLRVSPLPFVDKQTVEVKTLPRHGDLLRKNSGKAQKPLLKIIYIAVEVAVCHACELHKQRLYPVAGSGSESVRLMVVGDWLAADEKGELPPGHLFGVSQDQMLSRMLTAINLPASEVFITNVIKCAVSANCQPQAAHVRSCVSFLRRQVVALRPEIICTMGMVAARALLERPQSLSQLRGQILQYELDRDTKIPVISTYHPTYLLQNPEMKQATWSDLQLLAKTLGLKPAG